MGQRERSQKYARTAKGRAAIAQRKGSNKARLLHNRRSKLRRQRGLDFLRQMKNKPCMDCGGMFDPVCMDFDHRPGEVKLFTLSHAVTMTVDRLKAEIAKCDLVCANCHRIRTLRGRNHADYCNRSGRSPTAMQTEFDLTTPSSELANAQPRRSDGVLIEIDAIDNAFDDGGEAG